MHGYGYGLGWSYLSNAVHLLTVLRCYRYCAPPGATVARRLPTDPNPKTKILHKSIKLPDLENTYRDHENKETRRAVHRYHIDGSTVSYKYVCRVFIHKTL